MSADVAALIGAATSAFDVCYVDGADEAACAAAEAALVTALDALDENRLADRIERDVLAVLLDSVRVLRECGGVGYRSADSCWRCRAIVPALQLDYVRDDNGHRVRHCRRCRGLPWLLAH